MNKKTYLEIFYDWILKEWTLNPDFSIDLYVKIEEQLKTLIEYERNQFNTSVEEKASIEFLYTEVEGEINNLYNSRHENN